jgi:hypothetical protein
VKICCDKINSDFTAQFVTEIFSALKVLCHLSALVGVLQSSVQTAYITDVEKAKCVAIGTKPLSNIG